MAKQKPTHRIEVTRKRDQIRESARLPVFIAVLRAKHPEAVEPIPEEEK